MISFKSIGVAQFSFRRRMHSRPPTPHVRIMAKTTATDFSAIVSDGGPIRAALGIGAGKNHVFGRKLVLESRRRSCAVNFHFRL